MRIGIREPLTAARTYYVRTDGNDNNTGLTDDAAGAFRTIQKGVDVACADLDGANYSCVIQVRTGTYAESVVLRPYLSSTTFTLRGDNTTPSNVAISPSSGAAVRSWHGTNWQLEGFKLTSSNSHGLTTSGRIDFQNVDFGVCSGSHVSLTNGGDATSIGNYSISGGAQSHVGVDGSGASARIAGTVTVTGTPAFGVFATAIHGASLVAAGTTFVGSATGTRYTAQTNGVIDTGGGGANFFPGNAAGTTATGGQYV